MNDADYAETPHLRAHRCASLGLVILSIALLAWLGAEWASPRVHVRTLFPLILIWFPGQLSHLAVSYGGSRSNPANADTIVRIVGWIGLILLLGAIYLPFLPGPEVR